MIIVIKANQKNVWESLECLACVHAEMGDYESALEEMNKAISFYTSYCVIAELPGEDEINTRLRSKLRLLRQRESLLKKSMKPLRDSLGGGGTTSDEENESGSKKSSARMRDDEENGTTDGNETIDEKRESMKRFVADLRRRQSSVDDNNTENNSNQESSNNNNDDDEIDESVESSESENTKMFKNQIIDLTKK